MPYSDPDKKKQYQDAYNKKYYQDYKNSKNLVSKATNSKTLLRQKKKDYLIKQLGSKCPTCEIRDSTVLLIKSTPQTFIRKWGDWIKNDEYQFPIINPKYDIGFIIQNPNLQLLEVIEPWCSRIYISDYEFLSDTYLKKEQPNTSFDLNERVKPFDNEKNNEILVEIDGNNITNQDFQTLQQLSEIIMDSGEKGEFNIGNLDIKIFNITTHENKLIICKNNLIK